MTLNGGIQSEVQASEGSRGQLALPRHRSQGAWSLQRLRVQSGGSAPPPPPAASLSHCLGVAVGRNVSGRFCSLSLSFTKRRFGHGSGVVRGLRGRVGAATRQPHSPGHAITDACTALLRTKGSSSGPRRPRPGIPGQEEGTAGPSGPGQARAPTPRGVTWQRAAVQR